MSGIEGSKKEVSRKSGLELLRIFAAFSVVILHYRENAVDISAITNTNKIILYFLKVYVDVLLMFSFLFQDSFYVKHRKE